MTGVFIFHWRRCTAGSSAGLRLKQALDEAEKLSTKDEDKQYVEFLRGSTYERQKKYEKAEETFHKILVAHPDDAATLNYLGYTMADRGERLDSALVTSEGSGY